MLSSTKSHSPGLILSMVREVWYICVLGYGMYVLLGYGMYVLLGHGIYLLLGYGIYVLLGYGYRISDSILELF